MKLTNFSYRTAVSAGFCLSTSTILFTACQEDAETIHPQPSQPENLSDPFSTQLMTQAYHQFSPEEYERFVRKEYALRYRDHSGAAVHRRIQLQ